MRGHEGLPMRCGTKTWGFRHLVAAGRWSANFDGWIALTLGSGTEVTYLKYGGDEKLFVIFDQRCNAEFWVWYNRGAYNGNGVRPQGLISAYWQDNVIPTTPGQAPAAPQDVPPPPKGGRSDCPVYQPIGNPW